MTYEYDVVVVGAGPGGYVCAIRAAQLGLKTAIIEKDTANGGTCLNRGCIPSKTLLHFSEIYHLLHKEGKQLGFNYSKLSMDTEQLLHYKSDVIQGLERGVGGLLKKNKVDRIQGLATFSDPHTLQIQGGNPVTAANIVIATGSEPIELPFLPFDENTVMSSTGALSCEKVPDTLLVIGAGVIGLELGSVFSRLGSKVIFVEFLDQIAGRTEAKLSKTLLASLKKQGMEFYLSSKVLNAEFSKQKVKLICQGRDGKEFQLDGDKCLVSIGRRSYTQGLGLGTIQIEPDKRGFIPIDRYFRTNHKHIYAIGDVVEGLMLAHKASYEGEAVAEIIHGEKPLVNYLSVPSVIYTHPEVASVGLTEAEAKEKQIETISGSFSFKGNSRAHCVGETDGFVSIVADKKTQQILGMHMIGPMISEHIAIGVLAVNQRLKVEELASICFPHPTFSEAVKEAALATLGRAIHN